MTAGNKGEPMMTGHGTVSVIVKAGIACLVMNLVQVPAAGQDLSSNEVKNLQNVSRALLLSRAAARRALAADRKAQREPLQAAHDVLAGLERVVRAELLSAEVASQQSGSMRGSLATALRQARRAPVSARFDGRNGRKRRSRDMARTMLTGPRVPEEKRVGPRSRQSVVGVEKRWSGEANSGRRGRVDRALDRALLRIASKRRQFQYSLRLASTKGASPVTRRAEEKGRGKAYKPPVGSPERRVVEKLHRVEAQLRKMRRNGEMDIKKLVYLRQSVAMKLRTRGGEEPEPTMQTITKHRPIVQ